MTLSVTLVFVTNRITPCREVPLTPVQRRWRLARCMTPQRWVRLYHCLSQWQQARSESSSSPPLTNMALSQPPLVFADRFLFTAEIVEGGQGIVAFARGRDAGMRQYAIKCALCNPIGMMQAVGGT
jgi:hypothetical protein